MTAIDEVAFLFDCDNTLLDNDGVLADWRAYIVGEFGAQRSAHFWDIFDRLREELGYADYLGAVQRFRLDAPTDPHVWNMAAFLLDYPFAKRLYPDALAVLAQLRRQGPTVILSDGDAVYQPRKIQRSGLWQAVEGRVLIYVHKEQMIVDLERHYPARRYVLVDDKLRILAAMKSLLGERITTVFPRQGHYASDARELALYPPADVTIERIGELLDRAGRDLHAGAAPAKR